MGKLGTKPKRTRMEAAKRWLPKTPKKETSSKASHEMDKLHLRWLHPYLGKLSLQEINFAVIDKIRQKRVSVTPR